MKMKFPLLIEEEIGRYLSPTHTIPEFNGGMTAFDVFELMGLRRIHVALVSKNGFPIFVATKFALEKIHGNGELQSQPVINFAHPFDHQGVDHSKNKCIGIVIGENWNFAEALYRLRDLLNAGDKVSHFILKRKNGQMEAHGIEEILECLTPYFNLQMDQDPWETFEKLLKFPEVQKEIDELTK